MTFPKTGIGGPYPLLLSAAVNFLGANLNMMKKNTDALFGASKEIGLEQYTVTGVQRHTDVLP
jgi:hypothetical protein